MPWLQLGQYTHFTNSMHVYDRHYDMIARIIRAASIGGSYVKHHVPHPTYQEAIDLYNTQGKGGTGDYCTWLKT
jgi:thymidylate synthase